MCSLRICTSLPSRRLILGLRCYTTLADQSHIESAHRSFKSDDHDAQDIQVLQEKKNLQGIKPSTRYDSRIDPTVNARSALEARGTSSIEPFSRSSKQVGQEEHDASNSSLAAHEELTGATLQDDNAEEPKNTYEDTIAKLCDNGDVDGALFWHRKLVANGDAPQRPQHVEKLRQMLIDRRDWAAALEVKKSILSQDVELGPPSLSSPQDEANHKKELQSLVSKLDERVGVVRFHPSMDDQTCARFFATTFFSVEFVMEGMVLFGITRLGSLSIQEIIKRTIRGQHCDSTVARQYFTRMQKLGIECSTRYGRLLESLAFQGKDVLLHSTVTSDFHPDMYDDLQLQESMLQSQDKAIVERTRLCLSFEMGGREVEIRNLLLRAGLESIDSMMADGVPIVLETRAVLLDTVYAERPPWILETRLRILTRVFLRLSYVTAAEWRLIMLCFVHIIRPHLRRDFESLVLSLRQQEVFDTRMVSDIIRWYLRLGSLGEHHHSIETMLGGIRVLVALRNQGTALEIQSSCEANLVSLFGDTPIGEKIDMRKRAVARSLGSMEDFIAAIQDIWGPGLWPGLSPSEVKERIFARAKVLEIRRREMARVSLPTGSHTGSYNPGKVRYLRKQMSGTGNLLQRTSLE